MRKDERSIVLHVRCSHCLKLYQRDVRVPEGDDVPLDGEELVESEFVRNLTFRCPKCEAVYAEIVAFKIQASERSRPEPSALALSQLRPDQVRRRG